MGLLGKFFKKEEKTKGGCCSFNLEDEIAKVNVKEDVKKEKKSSCCDFNLDAEIEKAKVDDKGCDCGGKC